MAPFLIDTHHHIVTDFYEQAVNLAGGDPSGWPVPRWSLEEDKAFNKSYGINFTILSLTAPGACILKDPKQQAELARKMNEYMAQIRDEHPSQYGFFAALPSLMNADLALAEIAYALDTLKADGITLFTRYGNDNHYLGHPDFLPIWDDLNNRKAVVFIHPTHPVDTNLINPELKQPALVYPFETTQTATDLLLNKTLKSRSNVRVILSHAGGMLPWIITRVVSPYPPDSEGHRDIMEGAKMFYYDLAISTTDNVLSIMEKFADPERVLYGSDFPYAPPNVIGYHKPENLDKFQFADPDMKDNIRWKNAVGLFPRLGKYFSN